MNQLFKIILSLLFFLNVSPSLLAQEDLVSPKERSLYMKRLKLFGLLETQKPEKEEKQESGKAPLENLPQKLLGQLQASLETDYLNHAQKVLGRCEDEECLTKDSFEGRVLIDQEGESHCYPYTNCEYYRCMEEKYHCMDVGVEYFKNLAKPTCEAYVSNVKKGKFSSKGKEWIFNVMVCLQKGLFEECSLNGNCPISESNEKTCKHITDFTLKFHPGCYINSGVGVCKLPLKDQINIWRTVGPFLTARERVEAYKVVRFCLFKTPIE